VNYYKRHIGDYAAATRHLSLLEHGVYAVLLDVYYGTEKPLPSDRSSVYRLVGATKLSEKNAVDVILKEFFVLHEHGFHQIRCDKEIAHKQEKGQVNQVLGQLGGRPKLITDSVIPENPNGLRLVSVPETESNPSHKPIANSQDIDTALGKPTAIPDCPHLVLIDLYGKHLPELPQPRPELWDGKNAANMRARWKWVLTARKRDGSRYAENEAEALDFFTRFFAYVSGSAFLSGRNGKWGGCDLGWLVKADNFAKVVQGNYEEKRAA
jgi:hypothetical protein